MGAPAAGALHMSDQLRPTVFPHSGDDTHGTSRAQFVARAVLAGGTLAAGGAVVAALPRLAASAASPAQDQKILNFALGLEYMEAAFADGLGAQRGLAPAASTGA